MRYPLFAAIVSIVVPTICTNAFAGLPGAPADPAKREHDEIVVAGQFFHTGGASVVLWTDPDGRDLSDAAPRPTTRPGDVDGEIVHVRGGDATLDDLRQHVDQFVIHFDACGTSLECFRVLKRRRLSVQFMCDLDGAIYQAMDVRDAAQHATIANTRSVGVEVANIGGYVVPGPVPAIHKEWYRKDNGQTRITIPPKFGDGGIRTPNFIGRPARPDPVEGLIQGKTERQYDFTPQQYRAIARLAATLCTVLPKIQPDFPRQRSTLGPPHVEPATQPIDGDPTRQPAALAEPDQPGMLIPHVLAPDQYQNFQGVLGHYHVQLNKDDPGPAFQWIPLMGEVRRLMSADAKATNVKFRHQPATRPTATPPAATSPTTMPTTEP